MSLPISDLLKQEFSTITLMRHGEPSNGLQPLEHRIFRGSTDEPLTQKGWQQMAEALENITDIELIMTSPLLRCAEFSQKISKERSLPILTIDTLKEIDFGDWDGQAVQTIEENDPERLYNFWQDPLNNTPPKGEPVLSFQQRVITFWNKMLAEHRGKNCLLISHGGVQKIILAEVLNMPIQAIHNIEVPYACCTSFQVYYNGPKTLVTLKSHNILNNDV